METIFPTSSSWMMQQNKSSIWTKEENKLFESAIAIYDENTPNRWFQVADMIPGKSVLDVMMQYQELAADVCDIEAGLVPNPGYFASSDCGLQTFRKRGRSSDQERKKGVPWTEEEHRRFLMGLDKYGKGDWRNISKKMVISRTPTQVASHAQKYYQRQLSGCKDKRRPSIHDITTFHFVADDTSQNNINSKLHKFTTTTDVVKYWNSSSDEHLMSYGSSTVAYPYELSSQSWDGHGAIWD
ncbi:PREDICTED: transcription factor DIVARICATA-like [Nicotiana attenuata]|uniref:Transcription factor myb1r1 n=1 Tax=Nicotiana attenuata TaxID=49451 RepID=A0A1J6L1Z6_NICAT|nr:PREDICTED: transcription factor DIVARICATA-like [Nicotiana attenuata]OIT27775.1 transcription factor myb1r1 [Nicotiana attenuata]